MDEDDEDFDVFEKILDMKLKVVLEFGIGILKKKRLVVDDLFFEEIEFLLGKFLDILYYF